MIFDNNTAKKTAELLLQINAIKLNSKNPFTWASGWKSPIYCDNRIILSFPPVRNYIREAFAKHIEEKFGKPDVIAGVATSASCSTSAVPLWLMRMHFMAGYLSSSGVLDRVRILMMNGTSARCEAKRRPAVLVSRARSTWPSTRER